MSIQGLSGLEKASMLLLSLGASASAQVFQHLSESEIDRLSDEVVRIREIDPGLRESVLKEFETSRNLTVESRPESLPEDTRPFDFLCRADTARVARVLGRESPSIIALVLVNLPPDKAGDVLSRLGEDLQAQVASRICCIEGVEQDVLRAVEEALRAELLAESPLPKERATEVGYERAPDPAFSFEDIFALADDSMRRLLLEVDRESLRLALKGAESETREAILRNLPQTASDYLEQADPDQPVRIRDIEEAQQSMVETAKRLLASNHIEPPVLAEAAL